ncbi:DUF6541 family protein [Actinokineospora sp.]|uniref:DUF6541 family protein n=1 Tax=Actinokineospora sp. TaxID=1872133 RepID=UPI0040384BF0
MVWKLSRADRLDVTSEVDKSMTWFEAAPSALAALAWLLALGLPVTYALGLRGIAAWAFAPVISVLVVAGTAVAAGMLGIDWSALLPIAVSATTAVVVGGAAFLLRKRRQVVCERDPRGVRIAAAAGLLPAAVLAAITIVRGFGRPDNLSQTYDALFHYNAVALILDVRNASSLSISSFGNTSAGNFYPAAWHDLVSLIVLTTGAEIPVATNVLAGAVAAVVWPLSCVFLARQLFGRSPAAMVITGLLSIGFSANPWGLLGFGVLWPNALGMAIAPVGLALIVSLSGLAKDDVIGRGRAWLLLPVTMVAAVFAHPGVLFSLVVFSLFPVGQALIRRTLRLHRAGQTRRGLAEALGVTVALGAVWYWTATTSNPAFASVREIVWTPFETPSRAVGEVLLNATNGREALWLLSALVIVGFVSSLRTPAHRWLPAAHVATGVLYLFTASLNRPDTILFTGYWYNDSFRLAAMLPVTAVPLAVAGVLFLTDKITARVAAAETGPLKRVADNRFAVSTTAVAGLLVVLLAVVTQGMHAPDRYDRLAGPYLSPPPTNLLTSPGQRGFFERVKQRIPEDAVVANNPWDGSGMLWALEDRRTLFPHFTAPATADQLFLARSLSDVTRNPRVCQVANSLRVEYLLIGDAKFWPWDQRTRDYPGLKDPQSSGGFELVESEGGSKLYRISACASGQLQSGDR